MIVRFPMIILCLSLLLSASSWGKKSDKSASNDESSSDETATEITDQTVANDLATTYNMYEQCKTLSKPSYSKVMMQEKGDQFCFSVQYRCEGGSGDFHGSASGLLKNVKCISAEDVMAKVPQMENQGSSSSYSSGGGNGGINIHCPAACYSKCSKDRTRACIRCLKSHGYGDHAACVYRLLQGASGSCGNFVCNNCVTFQGDFDCAHGSSKSCVNNNPGGGDGGGRGGDYCPSGKCHEKGMGWRNFFGGLGELAMGLGVGVGASGVVGLFKTKECFNWYRDYNGLNYQAAVTDADGNVVSPARKAGRMQNDESLVDANCSRYAGSSGLNGFGIPGMGFGVNPGFSGNFAGPYGNYNPYGNLGYIGGGINLGGNVIGGGFGGGYVGGGYGGGYVGGGYGGGGYVGGGYGGGYVGGGYGGGYMGGGYGGGYNGGSGYGGGYGQAPWFNGAANGTAQGWGGRYNSFMNDRYIQDQYRYQTGSQYLAPRGNPVLPGGYNAGYPGTTPQWPYN